jgi:hexosaminidase
MIFTSVEGEEKMFPDYSILPQGERLHGESTDEFEDNPVVPRVDEIMRSISFDTSRLNSSLIGEINAGWSDEGVHPETFWLGHVASVSAAWHPGSPSVPELASSFYSLFYGASVVNMDRVYRLMSEQAQSWTDSWDPIPSKARKPIWGSSYEIFATPHPAHDQTLPLPPAPDGDLHYSSTWSNDNMKRIGLASQAKRANDDVLGLLYDNLKKSQFNRYNLQVYVSIADLCRQSFTMVEDIHRMDAGLAAASQIKDKDPAKALLEVDAALDTASSIWQKRNEVLQKATATWYQRWFPVMPEANGRRFLDELDDVKDHLPGRTADMSYLVYREKLLPFGDWVNAIAVARNQFATAHHLPVRDYHLSWDNFAVTSPWFAMELSSTAATAAAQ